MNVSSIFPWLYLAVLLDLVERIGTIQCYKCKKDVGSCNEGKCIGKSCLKLEATKRELTHVTKGCTIVEEEPSCVTTGMGDVRTLRCVCDADWCNGDEQLVDSGFQDGTSGASGDRSKRTRATAARPLGLSPNYLVMLIFLCLFLTGAFSLLIFNTVCVHLC